jgi:hypothetical protein
MNAEFNPDFTFSQKNVSKKKCNIKMTNECRSLLNKFPLNLHDRTENNLDSIVKTITNLVGNVDVRESRKYLDKIVNNYNEIKIFTSQDDPHYSDIPFVMFRVEDYKLVFDRSSTDVMSGGGDYIKIYLFSKKPNLDNILANIVATPDVERVVDTPDKSGVVAKPDVRYVDDRVDEHDVKPVVNASHVVAKLGVTHVVHTDKKQTNEEINIEIANIISVISLNITTDTNIVINQAYVYKLCIAILYNIIKQDYNMYKIEANTVMSVSNNLYVKFKNLYQIYLNLTYNKNDILGFLDRHIKKILGVIYNNIWNKTTNLVSFDKPIVYNTETIEQSIGSAEIKVLREQIISKISKDKCDKYFTSELTKMINKMWSEITELDHAVASSRAASSRAAASRRAAASSNPDYPPGTLAYVASAAVQHKDQSMQVLPLSSASSYQRSAATHASRGTASRHAASSHAASDNSHMDHTHTRAEHDAEIASFKEPETHQSITNLIKLLNDNVFKRNTILKYRVYTDDGQEKYDPEELGSKVTHQILNNIYREYMFSSNNVSIINDQGYYFSKPGDDENSITMMNQIIIYTIYNIFKTKLEKTQFELIQKLLCDKNINECVKILFDNYKSKLVDITIRGAFIQSAYNILSNFIVLTFSWIFIDTCGIIFKRNNHLEEYNRLSQIYSMKYKLDRDPFNKTNLINKTNLNSLRFTDFITKIIELKKFGEFKELFKTQLNGIYATINIEVCAVAASSTKLGGYHITTPSQNKFMKYLLKSNDLISLLNN